MLKFAPIMPAFCSLRYSYLSTGYYSNTLSGKIDASLELVRFEILLFSNQRRFKKFNVGATLQKYFGWIRWQLPDGSHAAKTITWS